MQFVNMVARIFGYETKTVGLHPRVNMVYIETWHCLCICNLRLENQRPFN